MLNKNYMTGNTHLTAEENGDFGERISREHPELAVGIAKLKTLISQETYNRAFSNIQTFNRRGDMLLIVSGGILQRTFLEKDCIPALKEAFDVSKVQIIG